MGNPSVLQLVRRSVNFMRRHNLESAEYHFPVTEKILAALEDARDMRAVFKGLQIKREVCPQCKRRTMAMDSQDLHPICRNPGCR